MAEFPALPLWTDAYLADCSHLTDSEHGRYLQLLMLMWRTPNCRVPNDNKWLARRLRRSVDEVHEEIRPLIVEFCDCDGNWVTQKRLQKEWKFVQKRSRKNRASAKARWNNKNSDANGDATSDAQSVPEPGVVASAAHSLNDAPTPIPTPTPTPTPTATSKVTTDAAPAAGESSGTGGTDERTALAAPRPEGSRESAAAVPHPAVAVIAAFDAERKRVFGAEHARPHPNATDLAVAKAMLEGGADLETCRFVFRATFERQKAAGNRPAAMLRYMRDPVADAVTDGAADPLAIPEKFRRAPAAAPLRNPADVQRAGRVESYRRAVAEGRAPFWLDEWGDPPGGGGETEAGG